ncbi:MAG TPA: DinB family protein [Gemmatimonadales bacterium]|nr:DinB family protein [Gemmatimonadales bacterium]
MAVIAKPADGEFLPYYSRYIDLIPECDLARLLQQQIDATRAVFSTVGEDRAGYRYAPGKWSIREVLGHLADIERVMTYRLLTAARADATPLPGMDENAWVPSSGADQRKLADLVDEFSAIRAATIALCKGLSDEAWTRRGVANGHAITPRALGYIVAGHERHHLGTLRTRYAVGVRE